MYRIIKYLVFFFHENKTIRNVMRIILFYRTIISTTGIKSYIFRCRCFPAVVYAHLYDDLGEKLAGIVLPDVAVHVMVVEMELEVQRVPHVVHARVGPVLGVHLAVEQPVGVYGRHHVGAAAVDLHAEARRHLVRGGAGHGHVRPVQLRQAGHAVVRDPAHVHARLVVVERMAPELPGGQAQLLAPVHGGHVLVNGVHRLQQLAGHLREVAHLRLVHRAVGFHVVDGRRPIVDGRPPGHREPVYVVQVTVARVLVEVDGPASPTHYV